MQTPVEDAPRGPSMPRWALPLLMLVLFCAAAFSLVDVVRERRQTQDLASQNLALKTSLTQVQSQLASVTDKLAALSTTFQSAPTAAPAPPSNKPRPTAAARVVVRRSAAGNAADDKRWKQVQDKLSDQEKAIASTRREVDQTRQDLEGKLNSSHDELNGSIARTHDELVALEKRGERNFYEFQLDKSKQFQRVGPISLSLRKVNTKHRSYDMTMLVEDQQLQKKGVNQFEPVLITVPDRPQPLELVVNEVHKNQIKGYLSEPKYKKSELASSTSPDAKPAKPDMQRR